MKSGDLSDAEIDELILHVAHYGGWPMAAVASQVVAPATRRAHVGRAHGGDGRGWRCRSRRAGDARTPSARPRPAPGSSRPSSTASPSSASSAPPRRRSRAGRASRGAPCSTTSAARIGSCSRCSRTRSTASPSDSRDLPLETTSLAERASRSSSTAPGRTSRAATIARRSRSCLNYLGREEHRRTGRLARRRCSDRLGPRLVAHLRRRAPDAATESHAAALHGVRALGPGVDDDAAGKRTPPCRRGSSTLLKDTLVRELTGEERSPSPTKRPSDELTGRE